MSIKGVIFDLNGTLVWDSPLHEQAWSEFAFELRGSPLTQAELINQVHGRVNSDVLTYLTGRPLDPDEIDELSERKEIIYRNRALALGDEFRLSPGAERLLEELSSRGVPRTIATASGLGNVNFFAEHLHLANWFDPDLIVYDDGSFPGKPSPDIFLRAAMALEMPPEECAVVEDSVSGLLAAEAARIGKIVALAPVDKREKLDNLPRIDLFIESFKEVDRSILMS